MNIINLLVGSAFLILISVIDVLTFNKKNGYIPSILTTIFLILAFMSNFPYSLFSGVLAGLLALFFTDMDFWGGIADFKVFVAAGMLFATFNQVGFFACVVAALGLIYKIICLKILKKKDALIPFIPVIFLSFFLVALFLFVR